jgi:predicted HAD superfamily Cof-like phosphohydrolase
MDKNQERVLKFMQAAGQHTPNKVYTPDANTRMLRARLLLEEVNELIEAMGLSCTYGEHSEVINLEKVKFIEDKPVDLAEVADGIADIKVISDGTAIAFGIDMEPVDLEVYESNMSKFGPGGYMREDGKWMKPPTWKAPNIEAIILAQS